MRKAAVAALTVTLALVGLTGCASGDYTEPREPEGDGTVETSEVSVYWQDLGDGTEIQCIQSKLTGLDCLEDSVRYIDTEY